MRSRWSALRRARAVVVTLTAAGMLAGCGEDATGPALTGSVQAYVGDGDQSAAQPASSESPSPSSHGGGTYSGSMSANAQVSISAGGDAWVDLGPPSSVSLLLRGSGNGADVHGEVQIPAGVYTRVRLVLSGAEAQLNAGSTIGGITLTASTTLTVGANGTVVIEKTVPPFEVRANMHTSVYWDLNSEHWVHEDNAQDEQVEEQEVDDASDARTVSEPRDSDMK